MTTPFHDLAPTLREFENCMLVTAQLPSGPSARPMQIGEVDDDGTVWFLSKHGSGLVHAIEHESHVAVVCQRPDLFVSLSGLAEVYQFPAKLREIWRDSFSRWLPEGPETPDAVAVRVVPMKADRWDGAGNHAHFG